MSGSLDSKVEGMPEMPIFAEGDYTTGGVLTEGAFNRALMYCLTLTKINRERFNSVRDNPAQVEGTRFIDSLRETARGDTAARAACYVLHCLDFPEDRISVEDLQ